MHRLLIGIPLAVLHFSSIVACTSPPREDTGSQSSKSESLECLPLHFSLCDWSSAERRIVMGYQIWGEPDGYGNCLYGGVPYGEIEPTLREALASGEVPNVSGVTPYIRELCGWEPESCGLIIDDTGAGLPNVYGKCL